MKLVKSFALWITTASLLGCGGFCFSAETLPKREMLDYEFVKVKTGSYVLSIPLSNSYETRYLTKKVVIERPFWLGRYEVTYALWARCHKDGACLKVIEPRQGERAEYPLARASWIDAFQLAKWFANQSGKKVRLPTEEEWVYATSMGKDRKETEQNFDYSQVNPKTFPAKRTQPRGSFSENAWGIADFVGNVWEWTLTCWYSSDASVLKPANPAQLNSLDACTTRIIQGDSRAHVSDIIDDTYSGGCAGVQPASNLGFRLLLEDDS